MLTRFAIRRAPCVRAEAFPADPRHGKPDPSPVVIFLHSGYTAGPCPGSLARVSARLSAPEPLAQLVEQQPFKLRVAGSIPARLITFRGTG